jgi:hypothetical protein
MVFHLANFPDGVSLQREPSTSAVAPFGSPSPIDLQRRAGTQEYFAACG